MRGELLRDVWTYIHAWYGLARARLCTFHLDCSSGGCKCSPWECSRVSQRLDLGSKFQFESLVHHRAETHGFCTHHCSTCSIQLKECLIVGISSHVDCVCSPSMKQPDPFELHCTSDHLDCSSATRLHHSFLYILLLWLRETGSRERQDQSGEMAIPDGPLTRPDALLIIAHPDDESMFFGPMLRSSREEYKWHVMCLSTGAHPHSNTQPACCCTEQPPRACANNSQNLLL